MNQVYPWHQVAFDLSVAAGMPATLESGFKQQIADELNRDIQTGDLLCWTASGDPIRGGVLLEQQRTMVPHLTVDAANNWLTRNGYLEAWEPVEPVEAVEPGTVPKLDLSILATRHDLIGAFGRYTGMNESWFQKLGDKPKLRDARRRQGVGMRGYTQEPLFCPFMVMQWLISPTRRCGGKVGGDKGWSLLEKHFPKVYTANSFADPRADQPG